MVSPKIEWIVKENPVYNVKKQSTEMLCFLRLNQIDKFNNSMNDVHVAEQLQGNYRMDHFACQRKWWWSILFWSIGVIITNCYVMYQRGCKEEGVIPAYGHYNFIKEISMYWMNPTTMEEQNSINYDIQTTFGSPQSTVSSITAASTLT